ncbi:MAG: hypothetical protein ACREPP_06185 [Rhodanobacteraceae bacterium]
MEDLRGAGAVATGLLAGPRGTGFDEDRETGFAEGRGVGFDAVRLVLFLREAPRAAFLRLPRFAAAPLRGTLLVARFAVLFELPAVFATRFFAGALRATTFFFTAVFLAAADFLPDVRARRVAMSGLLPLD